MGLIYFLAETYSLLTMLCRQNQMELFSNVYRYCGWHYFRRIYITLMQLTLYRLRWTRSSQSVYLQRIVNWRSFLTESNKPGAPLWPRIAAAVS